MKTRYLFRIPNKKYKQPEVVTLSGIFGSNYRYAYGFSIYYFYCDKVVINWELYDYRAIGEKIQTIPI